MKDGHEKTFLRHPGKRWTKHEENRYYFKYLESHRRLPFREQAQMGKMAGDLMEESRELMSAYD
jgi:hypothetical protein